MLTEGHEIWTPEGDDTRHLSVILARMADTIETALSSMVQSGMVTPYAGDAAPEGWLLCRGQAVSRTTYAKLFGVIGTTYGTGDGTATFNVPDLRRRVAVGLDSSDANFNVRGKTGGASTVALKTAELPAHSHRVLGGTNGSERLRSGRAFLNDAGPEGGAWAGWFGSGYNGIDNVSTSETGSGTGHNNLQPYITLNHIIKI